MTIENNGLLLNSLTTNIGTASVKAATSQGQDSFQSILSSTQSQKTEQVDSRMKNDDNKLDTISEKSSESKDATDKTSDEKTTDNVRKTDSEKTESSVDEKEESTATEITDGSEKTEMSGLTDEISDEELTTAMEALSSVVLNLVQDIAQEMGITTEELTEAIEGLNLNAEDILDVDKLKEVFLNIKGASDDMALLTDENLYTQFAEVTEVVKNTLELESGFEDKNVAELNEIISKAVNELNPNEQTDVSETETVEVDDTAEVAVDVPLRKEESWTRKEGLQTAVTEESNVEAVDNSSETITPVRTDNSKQNNHHGKGEEHGEAGNLMQNQNNSMDIAVDSTTSSVPVSSTTTFEQAQRIADQIMDQIRSMRKDDITTVEMQLHPATLGTLQINVANKGGVLTANFVTQNEAVKAALETQMVQLRESFEHQGIKVEAIEVSVATHSFEQNLEQEGHREENRESNSNGPRRVRRLQLGPDFGLDELENLDEADRLAAEMMAANGQTVDYQA